MSYPNRIRLVIVIGVVALLSNNVDALANVEGREVVVMVAPSIWDTAYEDIFYDLVKWQIQFANALRGRDNLVRLGRGVDGIMRLTKAHHIR